MQVDKELSIFELVDDKEYRNSSVFDSTVFCKMGNKVFCKHEKEDAQDYTLRMNVPLNGYHTKPLSKPVTAEQVREAVKGACYIARQKLLTDKELANKVLENLGLER